MSDTDNIQGLQAGMDLVQALAPQAIADVTPVLSAAIDRRSYPRKYALLVWENKETTATVHTMAATVTESATSGGSYTAATVVGTLTAISADGVQWAQIKPNAAKPFIKVTLTGSHADVDTISAASVLFF